MNFSVESKYPFRIFQDNDLICSWATIIVGWELKRLNSDEIKKFIFYFLDKHPDSLNKYMVKLLSENIECSIEELLSKIMKSLDLEFLKKDSTLWNLEWRKWRYCILCEMVKHISNTQELLIKVEGVYADFEYPEDMQHFIYYMPSNDNGYSNIEETHMNLLKKLKTFLQEEKIHIQKEEVKLHAFVEKYDKAN